MSKYSANIKGKILDYMFKPMSIKSYGYNFYIGDTLMGQIFKNKNDWSAVSWAVPCVYGVVDGFKNRLNAAEFILQVYRQTKNKEINE